MSAIDHTREQQIINARGPFTLLGVSRSPEPVAAAVSQALQNFTDISELQVSVDSVLSKFAGSEAGAVVHCAAAGITLAVAAAMTGSDPNRVAQLPDTAGLGNRVVVPAGHNVNYGHPVEQAIRLSGATPVKAGSEDQCTTEELVREIAHPDTCCLFLVVSRLTRGEPVDLNAAIAAAHAHNVPVIIDGAAQIFRARELIACGADLLIVSGQKYLGSPTAGLVFGRVDLVDGVRAQDKGIGRGMKASKEALFGVLAALDCWQEMNVPAWAEQQKEKAKNCVERLGGLPGVAAAIEPDPTDAPFPRVCLKIDPALARHNAETVTGKLKAGSPSIRVMDHRIIDDEILLELVPLRPDEVDMLVERLSEILG